MDVDELVIDGLAAVVDEVSNRDETGLIEVVPETAIHDSSVTEVKMLLQDCFGDIFELFPGGEIGNEVFLEFVALPPDMDYFFDDGPIESFEFEVGPIYCGFWF